MGQAPRPEHVVATILETLKKEQEAVRELENHCPEPKRAIATQAMQSLNALAFWQGWTHGEQIDINLLFTELRKLIALLNTLREMTTTSAESYGYIEIAIGWLHITQHHASSLLDHEEPVAQVQLTPGFRDVNGFSPPVGE